jgi:sulfite oxidase
VSAWAKHPGLVVWSEEPLNVETPLELLGRSRVTPTELFYVRNHGAVPKTDAATYRLAIEGMVSDRLALSFDDLSGSFPPATVTATLACAGNRRAELAAFRPIPGETPWGAGAIGNAVWTGVRLRDVLLAAGSAPEARHVAFTGLDQAEAEDGLLEFGGSIPIEKALSPEVILAFGMNGEPLQPAHGFPLRVVVPGYIGARSVKWLSTITVQTEPSSNYFQARGYRLFPPHLRARCVDAAGLALGEVSVGSALCRFAADAPRGRVLLEGYALAGGSRTVERVDVSLDDGETWAIAALSGPAEPGVWRLWRSEVEVRPGPNEAVVRAWDSAANTQPEHAGKIWNPKGYVNNAWHRFPFTAEAS